MSAALFVALERKVHDLVDEMSGKAWARVDARLDVIATRLGLATIANLSSCSVEDMADVMGDDMPPELEEHEEEWFDPEDGRQTLRGLLEHLEAHPEAMAGWSSPKNVVRDVRSAGDPRGGVSREGAFPLRVGGLMGDLPLHAATDLSHPAVMTRRSRA